MQKAPLGQDPEGRPQDRQEGELPAMSAPPRAPMTKRRIRQLRNAWKARYGGQAPADTRGTWGLTRLWAKIGGQKSERDFSTRLDYERSERRLMKRQHLRPEPQGRTLDRLDAMAAQAFRPKKHRRASNRQERARRCVIVFGSGDYDSLDPLAGP